MNRRLGSYQLIERLGVGGMAEVFSARAHRTGELVQPCVVKVLHSDLAQDESFTRMLLEEAQLVARLRHNNIASLYDVGQVDDELFLVMEYVAGRDLHSILAQAARAQRRVPVAFAVHVARQMCRGLHFAHTRQGPDGEPLELVHRDVSPPNVLVSTMGEVKLIDFGIAKFNSEARQKTKSGVIKGKFGYMAPEQAWDEPLDRRTDLFSTGVCLYEMLTGQTLYESCEDPMTMLRRAREADIEPVTERREDIPRPVVAIVEKALQCEREDRYSWAHHMERALSAALSEIAPDYTALDAACFIDELFEVDEPALDTFGARLHEETTQPTTNVPDVIEHHQNEPANPRPSRASEDEETGPMSTPGPDFSQEKTEVFGQERLQNPTAIMEPEASKSGLDSERKPADDGADDDHIFGGKTQLIADHDRDTRPNPRRKNESQKGDRQFENRRQTDAASEPQQSAPTPNPKIDDDGVSNTARINVDTPTPSDNSGSSSTPTGDDQVSKGDDVDDRLKIAVAAVVVLVVVVALLTVSHLI